MPRIFVTLLTSLLAVLLFGAAGSLKSGGGNTNAEVPALTNMKFEERAPVAELHSQSSKTLAARPAPKTGLEDKTVPSKARQGSMWTYEGSIMRLEAIGRARRFYYDEVHGAFSAKNGDIAFDGVREGRILSGRAYQFTANCTPLAYIVKGRVSADESMVKMQGIKPDRNARCDIT